MTMRTDGLPDDPDIGMCDLCGSEEGPRTQKAMFAESVIGWICHDCEGRNAQP